MVRSAHACLQVIELEFFKYVLSLIWQQKRFEIKILIATMGFLLPFKILRIFLTSKSLFFGGILITSLPDTDSK